MIDSTLINLIMNLSFTVMISRFIRFHSDCLWLFKTTHSGPPTNRVSTCESHVMQQSKLEMPKEFTETMFNLQYHEPGHLDTDHLLEIFLQ